MKKPILAGMAFIALDQAIKLTILRFAADARLVLMPGVLVFSPTRNTNLNWLSSMAGITPPVWLMVALQFLLLAAVILLFRYLSFRERGGRGLLSLFFSFAAAGICCSFIDVVFWGGSLDFLGLFDWFVFDTKDLFLNASWIVIVIWEIRRAKPDPARISVGEWVRMGFPYKPGPSGDAGR